MVSIAHFLSHRIRESGQVATEKTARLRAGKALDCVYILGPGHDQSMAGELCRRAESNGLSVTVIGDGKCGITREMIHHARSRGLIGPETQVVCMLHGGTRHADGRLTKTHVLDTGFERSGTEQGGRVQKTRTPTTQFLQWLRDSFVEEGNSDSQVKAWGGTVHLVSCHVRDFAKQFPPKLKDPVSGDEVNNPLWTQGNVLVYGSNKSILTEVGLHNFDALMRYLGDCKHSGQAPDVHETFRRLMVDSADTVTLLGGSLSKPLESHAPKTLLEAMPGYLQGQWQQLMAHEKLGAVATSTIQLRNDRSEYKATSQATAALPTITSEKIAQFFFTRLSHLQKNKKFDHLKSDLERFPGLANVRNGRNFTPLMLVALRSDKYKSTEVDAIRISSALLDAGAEINAQNASGKTVLHYAAGEGNPSLVTLLVSRGASRNVVDADKRSPLHWACMSKSNRLSVVKEMLKECDKPLINKRDRFGKSALHIAIASGDVEVVKALLAAGADPEKRTGGWESPTGLARRARISDTATDEIVRLLKAAIEAKKKPRRSGA